MKFGIVSTFSDNGYEEYAKHFVSSLENNLDSDVEVFLYVDNVSIKTKPNIHILNLEKSVPDITEFKLRNKDKTFKNFLWDAVRFSHKSYAIWHAAMNSNVNILIWLDADTEIINKLSKEYLKKFLPDGYFTSYLGRESYSETGFIAYDLRNPHSKEFFSIFKNYYDSDKIYTLEAFTDCHAFDATRKELEIAGKIKGHNLTPLQMKHHFNQTFNGYMIHFKGDRKEKRDETITKLRKKAK
jgi:hypothetical protein